MVDAVLTPDGDAFLFGAVALCTEYSATAPNITRCEIAESELDQRQFVALGLLLGTDYCDGVKGIGYKRARKLLDRAITAYAVAPLHCDWLTHIEQWVEMDEEELFQGTSPRDDVAEKFILQIRSTYQDIAYFREVVEVEILPISERLHGSIQCVVINVIQQKGIFTTVFQVFACECYLLIAIC